MTMSFKGVIFDLDGTLVDSLQDIADSMNAVLQSHNFPTHDLHAYKEFVGDGLRNLVRRVLPQANRGETLIDECYDAMIETYNNNCLNKTKPYDGVTELLDELVSRNLKLAIFSNKADQFTKKVVSVLLPKWNFAAVVGLTTEADKKPNPRIALRITDEMGLRPEETIYVGDSGVDMQTANNAGMIAVGVLWGFRSKQELTSHGAQHLLSHPSDLLEIL
jgi:phosphoglycolate phosphatase